MQVLSFSLRNATLELDAADPRQIKITTRNGTGGRWRAEARVSRCAPAAHLPHTPTGLHMPSPCYTRHQHTLPAFLVPPPPYTAAAGNIFLRAHDDAERQKWLACLNESIRLYQVRSEAYRAYGIGPTAIGTKGLSR